MSYAVKAVTTERGLDAGSFLMVVYGGAGPLHASAIAREIGIRKVLIPFAPGYFSAYGMLFSDLRYDYVRSCFRKLEEVSFEEIEALYSSMEEEGRAAIATSAIRPEAIVIERAADMRYVGQEHAVTVELPGQFFASKDRDAIKRRFDEVHAIRYGTSPRTSQPTSSVCVPPCLAPCASRPATLSTKGKREPPRKPCGRTRMCSFAVTGLSPRRFSSERSLRSGNRVEWTGTDRGTCLDDRGSAG